jgi:hypothetical protein
MRRRDFIKGITAAATAWPVAARAQQGERMRRIGWLPAKKTAVKSKEAWFPRVANFSLTAPFASIVALLANSEAPL